VDDELRAYGLTDATWRPLAYVGRLGEGVRQKELADGLGIQVPSLVRFLDTLERLGLIVRREQEDDRRARRIFLTQSGRRLQRRILRISDSIQERVLRSADPCDLEACNRLFAHVEHVLDGSAAQRNKDAM
jgi:MarR family transcriptional regulator for hemolysin